LREIEGTPRRSHNGRGQKKIASLHGFSSLHFAIRQMKLFSKRLRVFRSPKMPKADSP
jgi:hypothetical protein